MFKKILNFFFGKTDAEIQKNTGWTETIFTDEINKTLNVSERKLNSLQKQNDAKASHTESHTPTVKAKEKPKRKPKTSKAIKAEAFSNPQIASVSEETPKRKQKKSKPAK